MAKKLAGILLALILSVIATVIAIMLLNDKKENVGSESGTTQSGTTSSGSTSGNTNQSGSTGSESSSSSGDSSSGGSVAPHTCEYVYKTTVEGCFTQGYKLYECKYPGCGKTEKRNYTNPHESHDYVWTETTPATCSTEGEETGICSRCGDKSTKSIMTLDHEYGEYVSDGNATCGKDGTKTAKCQVCGERSTKTDKGTATGDHAYGAYKPNGDGTCQKEGTATATCATCGAKDTKTGVKGDHDYEWTIISNMCTKIEKSGVCKTCGELTTYMEIIHDAPASFHDIKKWDENVDPTCTEGGYVSGTCSRCGHVYTYLTNPTGHNYGEDGRCKTCGEAKYKIHLTPSETTAEEVFGTSYIEFILIDPEYRQTDYGSWMMQYEMYVVQEYTVNGEKKLSRNAVTLDNPINIGSSIEFKLLRLTDNITVTLGGAIDYSVIAESHKIMLKLDAYGTTNDKWYALDSQLEIEY